MHYTRIALHCNYYIKEGEVLSIKVTPGMMVNCIYSIEPMIVSLLMKGARYMYVLYRENDGTLYLLYRANDSVTTYERRTLHVCLISRE
jgi:hypothetical protein